MGESRWQKAIAELAKWVRRISIGGAIIAGVALLFMSVSTLADASLRKVFNQPIPGVVEINAELMVVTVFLALSMAQVLRSHIQITMALRRLPSRVKTPVVVIGFALCFAFFMALGIATLQDFVYAREVGQYRPGTGINIPMWPAKLVIPVGSFIICLQLLVDILLTVFPSVSRPAAPVTMEGEGLGI